jgi:glutathione S-transferase
MKHLPIAIEPPPVPLRSAEFKQMFPMGKIPILRTPQGDLAESWAIMEYLEDTHPMHPLRPNDYWYRAQMNMMARFTDLHFGPSFSAPFFHLLQPSGEAPSLQPLMEQVAVLERLLTGKKLAHVQLDDIALATTFYFALAVTEALKQPPWLESFPAVQNWWQWISSQTEVAVAIDEMDTAFQALIAR